MTDNTKGALLMMASLALFTLNDTLMKTLSGQVPLYQILAIRNTVTTAVLLLVCWRSGAFRRGMARRDWGLAGLRAAAEIGAAFFFLTALFNMPLANVTAVLQSAPLVVTLAAAIFLRERVGWRRVAAIVVGFMGVLLIIRPGSDVFDIFSVYILIAVCFITVRDLSTRRLSPDSSSMLVTALTSAAIMVFFGGMSVAEPWVPLTVGSAALVLGAAGFVLFAYLTSVMAMRLGEISFVSPFRYTALIWALVLGYVVFGDWPDWQTLLGAAIVAGSGLFMLYRERRIGHRAGEPLE
ncbi:DMT family transporter [Pseudooceanicola aestuarii]|uniref:DMT family transporter n=1 Tax=Pseudooceanicola aestuarii TaxID=2697319 RepID=UPI0013D0E2E3|nr:DMT family transporter [Pseudooceanicola aestuarii]